MEAKTGVGLLTIQSHFIFSSRLQTFTEYYGGNNSGLTGNTKFPRHNPCPQGA